MSPERSVPIRRIPGGSCAYLLLIFAYTVSVWQLPQSRISDFLVRCKGCGENIPAPVMTMPDAWIVAECPLCGEIRHYLPSEIFRGKLSYKLGSRKSRSVVP